MVVTGQYPSPQMAMLQTLTEFVCVLWGGIFVDVMRISPKDPAHFTMATPPLFPQPKHTFYSISSNWSLMSRTAAQKESDLILNGTFGRAKVSGWEVDKLWSCYCYCLVSMDIIPQMEICIQHIDGGIYFHAKRLSKQRCWLFGQSEAVKKCYLATPTGLHLPKNHWLDTDRPKVRPKVAV